MSASRTLRVEILGDAKSAANALKTTGDAAGGLSVKFEGLGASFQHAGAIATGFGAALSGAGIGLALKAFDGIANLFGSLAGTLGDAQNSAQVAAQLAAVLKSTGGAAGLTADDVNALSDSLSQLTGIDDEAITAAESVLLTFTNIGANVFPDTTKAVLDLSAAMGQDFKSSAVQVGKALNDPIAGITALTRVGVTFSEQQKDQIKAMVAAGNVAGAQKIILAELAKEFGGSAEAQATNVKRLAVSWGNFREEIGGALIPIVEKAAGALNNLLRSDQGQEGIQRLTDGITKLGGTANQLFQIFARRDFVGGGWLSEDGPLTTALFAIRDGLVAAWGPVQRFVGGIVSAGRAIFDATRAFASGKTNLGQFIGGIEIWVSTVLGNIGHLKDLIAPVLGAFGGKVLDFLKGMVPQIWGQLTVWGQRFGDWVTETAWPFLSGKLADLGAAIVGWVQGTAIPNTIAALVGLGQAFGSWVGDVALPFVTQTIPAWLAFVQGWISGTAVPAVQAELVTLGTAFADWITGTAVPYVQQGLPVWWAAIEGWLTGTAIPAATTALGGLAKAFYGWILTDALPYVLTNLPQWYLAIETWLYTTAIPSAVTALLELSKAFGDWVTKDAVPYLVANLPVWLKELGDWLRLTAGPAVLEASKTLGTALVDGVIAGLRASWDKISAELTKLAGNLPEPIRNALGIHSPSAVFADKVGLPIVQGIAAGIAGGADLVAGALGGVVGIPDIPTMPAGTAGLAGFGAAAGGAAGALAFGSGGGLTINTLTVTVPEVRYTEPPEDLGIRIARSMVAEMRRLTQQNGGGGGGLTAAP